MQRVAISFFYQVPMTVATLVRVSRRRPASYLGHDLPRTWVVGLGGPVQQADVEAAQVKDVVQGRYHHPPDGNDESNQGVDEEEQVGEQKETLPASETGF